MTVSQRAGGARPVQEPVDKGLRGSAIGLLGAFALSRVRGSERASPDQALNPVLDEHVA